MWTPHCGGNGGRFSATDASADSEREKEQYLVSRPSGESPSVVSVCVAREMFLMKMGRVANAEMLFGPINKNTIIVINPPAHHENWYAPHFATICLGGLLLFVLCSTHKSGFITDKSIIIVRVRVHALQFVFVFAHANWYCSSVSNSCCEATNHRSSARANEEDVNACQISDMIHTHYTIFAYSFVRTAVLLALYKLHAFPSKSALTHNHLVVDAVVVCVCLCLCFSIYLWRKSSSSL